MRKKPFPTKKVKKAYMELEEEREAFLSEHSVPPTYDEIEESNITFPAEFDRKMKEEIRLQNKRILIGMHYIPKFATWLLVVMLAAGITVYAASRGLLFVFRDKDVVITMDHGGKDEILSIYEPTYIPEDFIFLQREVSEVTVITYYEKSNNGSLRILQNTSSAVYSSDNENVLIMENEILGFPIRYFVKNDTLTLYFEYELYFFQVIVSPQIDIDLVIDMVSSFKILE